MMLSSLLVIAFSAYGMAWLLTSETPGPYDLIGKLRHLLGVRYTEDGERYATTVIAEALSCIMCTSFWTGLLAVLVSLLPFGLYLLAPFAVLGFTYLLEGLSHE